MADERNHTQTEPEEFADLLGPVPASAGVLYLQAILSVLLRLERHIMSNSAQSTAPVSPPKRRGRPPKVR
jgi:hypothetical protein